MSSKMKLPVETSNKLDHLSNSLNLKRNIICRIAIGASLRISEPPEINDMDYGGQEFNKTTILGVDEQILITLLSEHFGKKLTPDDFFSRYIRAEIIRGIDVLYDEYRRINSPTDFIKNLCRR